jgi:hypothetical protein
MAEMKKMQMEYTIKGKVVFIKKSCHGTVSFQVTKIKERELVEVKNQGLLKNPYLLQTQPNYQLRTY